MWHPSARWILFAAIISVFVPIYSKARPSKHYYQTGDDVVHVDHNGSGHFVLTGTSIGVRFPEACPGAAFTICYKTTYNFPRSLLCPTGFATMHVHSEGSTLAVNNEIVDTITIKNNQNYISNNKLISAPFEYEIDSSLEISFVNLHCAIELTGVTIIRNPDQITESAAEGKKDLNDAYNGSIAIYVIVAVFFGLLILVAIALSIWFCKFDPPVKKQKKEKEEKSKSKSKSESKSKSKSASKSKSKSEKVIGTKSKSAKEGDKKSDSLVPDKSKKSEKAIVSETSEKTSKSTTSIKSRPKYVAPTVPTNSNSKSASKQTVVVPAQNPKTPPVLLEPSDVVELMDETQKSSKKSKSKKSTSKPSTEIKNPPKAFIVVKSKEKTKSVDSACCTIPSGSAVKTPSPVDTTTILSEKLQQEEKLIEKSNRMVKTIRFTKPNDAREDERLARLAKINYGIPLSEKEAAAIGRVNLPEQSTQQESGFGEPSKPKPITPPNEDPK
uniref:ZP domain-containing protein n=1 Tax=Panagrellus redivivus TaxID=6233 RepID=A0A7E4VN63_PANRE